MSTAKPQPLTATEIDLDELTKSTTEILHLLAQYCRAKDSYEVDVIQLSLAECSYRSAAVYIAQQAEHFIKALDSSILVCRQVVKNCLPNGLHARQGQRLATSVVIELSTSNQRLIWKTVLQKFLDIHQTVQNLVETAVEHKEYYQGGDSTRRTLLESTIPILRAFEDIVLQYQTWWALRDIDLNDLLAYPEKISVIQKKYPDFFLQPLQSPLGEQIIFQAGISMEVATHNSSVTNEQSIAHGSESAPLEGIENKSRVYDSPEHTPLAIEMPPMSSITTEGRIGQITMQLPPELMAQIFAETCHPPFKSFRARCIYPVQKTTPFTLGQVCRHWRAVVWSTPFIWSYVCLELSCSPDRFMAQVELLENWLERSGTCPLTINLFYSDSQYQVVYSQLFRNLTKVLAIDAHRCQVVDFALPSWWYKVINEVKYNFTILTSARGENVDLPVGYDKFEVFKFAPLLNDIHLLASDIFIVDIEWERLVRITLQHVTLEECYYVLAKTPNLMYCLLEEVHGTTSTGTNLNVLLLQDLIISDYSWDSIEQLLQHMAMPSLQSVTISSTPYCDFLSLPTILDRAGCQLQRIRLDDLDLEYTEESEILLCLRSFPSLVEIDISFIRRTHKPIRHFLTDILMCQSQTDSALDTAMAEFDDTRTYLLTKLKHFRYSGPVGVGIVWFDDKLADLLQNRVVASPSITKLMSYEVNGSVWSKDPGLRDLSLSRYARGKLRELVEDGLKFKLVVDGNSLF
ncbi:hypothetical protein B0H34DRAFT_134083 [Crassisporium funariophilum]|nr:hypothetical protein B0H34DRAFT_134083 [Crassisporium funariophilum]